MAAAEQRLSELARAAATTTVATRMTVKFGDIDLTAGIAATTKDHWTLVARAIDEAVGHAAISS